MDSRTRVFLTLAHKEPDRVPVDFWAASEVISRLLTRYGYATKEELLQRFGVDFRYIDGPVYVGPDPVVTGDGLKEDHFGVPRRRVSYGEGAQSGATARAFSPLASAASIDEIEHYPKWPRADWFDYAPVREQARKAKETGKVVVFMGDRLNRCAQLKPAMYLRGMEQILMDLYVNRDIACAIFRHIADFYRDYLQRTLEAAEGNIDIVFTGDDFARSRIPSCPTISGGKRSGGFQEFYRHWPCVWLQGSSITPAAALESYPGFPLNADWISELLSPKHTVWT